MKTPTCIREGSVEVPHPSHSREAGMRRIAELRSAGMEPASCTGEIVLQNVNFSYPARPQRQVLNGMTLRIPAGKIAALVGQSGGGKSSVCSLVQHLYEPSSGKVMIDGIEVIIFRNGLTRNLIDTDLFPPL